MKLRRALLLSLLLTGFALPAAAQRTESVRGVGDLLQKDVALGTVTIDRSVYRMSEETVIRDVHGGAISLAQLPVMDASEQLALRPIAAARFVARRTGDDLELLSLRLVPAPR